MKIFIAKIKSFYDKIGSNVVKFSEKPLSFIKHYRWSEISVFRKVIFIIGAIFVFIFPLTAIITHTISDDINYRTSSQTSSPLISDIVGLINREVIENGWIANKPFFFPQAIFLDNMPSYQKGIIYGLSHSVFALGQISQDINIQSAAKALSFDGEEWGFGKNNAARQYIDAKNLLTDNSQNIIMTNDLLLALLYESNNAVKKRFKQTAKFLDSSSLFKTDNEFYFNRGMLYSLYIVLRDSFEELAINGGDKDLLNKTENLLTSLKEIVEYDPLLIISINKEPTIFSNNILVQNYHMAKISLMIEDIINRR